MNAEVEPISAPQEPCPICGAKSWSALFESRTFTIGRCQRCHVVRTLGVVPDGDAEYPPFDQRETLGVKAMRVLVTQLLRERAQIVESVSRAPARLLDVGCGSGAFARLMSQRGYDATGVEPYSLGRPVEEPNLRLVRAPLERVSKDLGTFDVITLWHVLEHFVDPTERLRALIPMLRPNGVLVVSVPNFDSWQSRLFRGGWFHLDPPRHITHFDTKTVDALFADVGFEIFERRTFHLEYGPVGWLQSTLNRILPRPNFLYEFVKDRGALLGVPASQIAANLLASATVGAALGMPAVLLEACAASLGAGAVITVAARARSGA